MSRHHHAFKVSAAIAFATACSASHATIYNAAADFSATNNPNGVWSFGEQTTLGTGFSTFNVNGALSGFDYWHSSTPGYLGAMHNGTGSAIFWGTVVINAGQLTLHPGPGTEYTLARFTAPTTATYTFSADFVGQDYIIGTTTDVHLLVNGVAVFSSIVNGYLSTASSGTFVMNLTAGDTIDAAVGNAGNLFYGDTTGLDFTVEAVPGPGPLAALATFCIVSRRRRA